MDVIFAVMPFADPSMPTLGVSLLKAASKRDGFSCAIRYFNIDFVDRLGIDLYGRIANSFPPESLVGEWFFADLVFGAQIPHEDDYLSSILARYPDGPLLIPDLRKARREAHRFIDWCASQISTLKPAVVGLPTTFHQTCAALALARKLKELPESPTIILGGANCEDEMGRQMLQSFPWIDYVCTQEGDLAFPAWLQQLMRRKTADPIPGIAGRHNGPPGKAPLVEDMNSLPAPDFDDYFEQIGNVDWAKAVDVHLVLETSRGCWWGAKQHCTFCGLNGASMAYRSKSPERAFDEIQQLVSSYGITRVECVDNILDNRYITTLFPKLAQSGLGIELFYEVKANLRLDQLRSMRAGGVMSIQPGIESLSSKVLHLMQKGVSAAQNIQLLRWCGEVGITVAWNLLGGFPGEPVDEYDRMAEMVPLLVHLQHPSSCGKFRLDRFSPHFTRPDSLGIERIRPMPAYYYVYPLTRRELMRLAYYFDFDHVDGREPDSYITRVGTEVEKWLAARANPEQSPVLDAFDAGGEIRIVDTRPCRTAPEHRLTGLAAALYAQCDTAHAIEPLARVLGEPADAIEPALEDIIRRKLMLKIDGQYLSLAVMRSRSHKPIERNRHDWIQITAAQAAEPLPASV